MTQNIRTVICVVASVVILLSLLPVQAQTGSPQDTLAQYVADLQKTPSDTALREKIIKLARDMNPPPAIPEEARRHYVIAKTLTKDTTKAEDCAEPIAEFKSVLLIAPWWGAANGEFGMLLEAAGRYDEAMSALKLFIATNPGEEKARGAQDEIYIIEAKQKKAVKDKELVAQKVIEEKQAQQEDAGAKKASEQEAFLKKINGARYIAYFHDEEFHEDSYATADVLGDTVTVGRCVTRSPARNEQKTLGVWKKTGVIYKIEGRALHCNVPEWTGIITEDGNMMTLTEAGDTCVLKRER